MPVGQGSDLDVVAGRYAVEAEIARGGMGVVYRVQDRSTGRVLALKRSRRDHSAIEAKTAALFESEYRTLSWLRHPRIIQVFDFGRDEHGAFYTMELLDGADLRARSPLHWREVCRNLRDVSSSLALLHSRRLLHRDVSASNIRLTNEGRAKLIDFGTLTSFGRSRLVAGTPPGIAPEALTGVELDQRADLFALGATAYYALTGRHAYPARTTSDLPSLWARGVPAPPSAIVAGIPKELDALILSLLTYDRSLRPASAAEVIDRLGAIAELPPDQDDRVAESYLVSQELVGRDKQQAILGARLEKAVSGLGSAVLVEGPAGHGRTSLLRTFESDARVRGAAVLSVSARAHQHAFGACRALVERARAERPDGAPEAPRDGRDESALEAFFLELSARQPTVVIVDDVEDTDAPSLRVLAALARTAGKRRLLVVTAVESERLARRGAALAQLARACQRLRLRPFTPEELERLVLSMFGEVPSTKRLAAWLAEQTGGVPLHCVELLTHLVREGRIHYAEGTWVLPHELPEADVRRVMASATEDRVARLSEDLRACAECLCPHRRPLEREQCIALCESDAKLSGSDPSTILGELVREGVLIEDRDTYVFAQPRFREFLYARLAEDRRRLLHRRAAQVLARHTEGSAEREFEVGRHLLLAGDRTQAHDRISLNMLRLTSRPDSLVSAVPELQELLREYRRIGGTPDELWPVTAPLVVSAYYVDPGALDEIGKSTAELLYGRSGFALAQKLVPWIGSRAGVLAGFLWGGARYVARTPVLRAHLFGGVVLSFIGACASQSAVADARFDPKMHLDLLRLLAPAKGLGEHNTLRLVHDLVALGLVKHKGDFAAAYEGYMNQLERLPKVRFFAEESRHHYEAGLLSGFGRCQLFRLGDGALECADRVDALGGQHDRILAQMLRCSFHLYRGESVKANRAEEVLDAMAAQWGYRWMPDVLAVMDLVPYHLSSDVLGLKHVLHRTEQVLAFAPAYALHRDVVRAMYEGHRGRPETALSIYERLGGALRPMQSPVWSFAHAHRAECLNTLGRHDEALAACDNALSHVGGQARVFVVAYQQLERERALALSGLGRAEEGARLLDELLVPYERESHPLLAGLLHRDRARIALAMEDWAELDRHSRASAAEFSLTENPTLIAQARRLSDLTAAEGAAHSSIVWRTPQSDDASTQRISRGTPDATTRASVLTAVDPKRRG